MPEHNIEEIQEIANLDYVVYLSYFYPKRLKDKILASIKSESHNSESVDKYLNTISHRNIDYRKFTGSICYQALRDGKIEVQRYFSVINVDGEFENNGLFLARSILLRLPTSLKSAQMLAVTGNFMECYVILRFVLEQLSLALKVKDLTYEESIKWQSQKCIGIWKTIDPSVGKRYGKFSEIAHVGQKGSDIYNWTDGETHRTIGTSKFFIIDHCYHILWLSEKYCFLCEALFPKSFPKKAYARENMLQIKNSEFERIYRELMITLRKAGISPASDQGEMGSPIPSRIRSSTLGHGKAV